MKKQNGIPILIILWFVLCILYAFVISLQIFEIKYLIVIADILLLWFLLILLILRKSKGFGFFLAIMTIIISIASMFYIKVTNDFIKDKFNSDKYKYTNTYYVIGNEIKDLGVYRNIPYINAALIELNKVEFFDRKEYSDIDNMLNDLNDSKINSIILDQSFYDFLKNHYDIKKYKILKKFSITKYKKIKKRKSKNKINIYVSGTDNLYSYSNTILTIDKKKHTIMITSIPREYYVDINNKKDLLKNTSLYGIDSSMKSLEKLYNIKIDYYIKLNKDEAIDLIDDLDGINYCSKKSYELNYLDKNKLENTSFIFGVQKGCNVYSGIEIVSISRKNNLYDLNQITENVIKKFMTKNTLLNYKKTLKNINKTYDTNIDKKFISTIIDETLRKKWKIKNQIGTGNYSNNKIHMTNIKGRVMIPNNIDKIRGNL